MNSFRLKFSGEHIILPSSSLLTDRKSFNMSVRSFMEVFILLICLVCLLFSFSSPYLVTKEDQEIEYSGIGQNLIYLDKKLLKNILFNLLSNAIKFAPEGKPIKIETSLINSMVMISVADNGIGISKDDQKHLFERFFRGRNATHIQGTGLGLSIVAKYAEQMKGTITFESKEKIGTKFIIYFPQ